MCWAEVSFRKWKPYWFKLCLHVTMHLYFNQYRQLLDIIYSINIIMLPMVVAYMDLYTVRIDTVDLLVLTL